MNHLSPARRGKGPRARVVTNIILYYCARHRRSRWNSPNDALIFLMGSTNVDVGVRDDAKTTTIIIIIFKKKKIIKNARKRVEWEYGGVAQMEIHHHTASSGDGEEGAKNMINKKIKNTRLIQNLISSENISFFKWLLLSAAVARTVILGDKRMIVNGGVFRLCRTIRNFFFYYYYYLGIYIYVFYNRKTSAAVPAVLPKTDRGSVPRSNVVNAVFIIIIIS